MSNPHIRFPIRQFEDMYGNKVGGDNEWHAHVRDVLNVGGLGDEYYRPVPGE